MQRSGTPSADHRFFTSMSLLAVVVVTLGFARTYPPTITLQPSIVHLHAAVFSCWLVLFATQAILAARGRLELHRRIGTVGMLLAFVMLALGAMTAISVARLGHNGIAGAEFPEPAGFLLLNLLSILVFFSLAVAAWTFRARPQVHKRLMLMATVGGLMPPGIARLPGLAGHPPGIGLVVLVFLLAGPVYDLATRRCLHPAYVPSLLLCLSTAPPLVEHLSSTGAWRAIAARLIA